MKIKEGHCFDGLCCFQPDRNNEETDGWRRDIIIKVKHNMFIEYDFYIEKNEIIKKQGWFHAKRYACQYLELKEELFRCSVYEKREELAPRCCIDYPYLPSFKCRYQELLEGKIKHLKMFVDEKEIEVPKSEKFLEGILK